MVQVLIEFDTVPEQTYLVLFQTIISPSRMHLSCFSCFLTTVSMTVKPEYSPCSTPLRL